MCDVHSCNSGSVLPSYLQYSGFKMQVIASVGFMDKRNEIPKETDPQWASLIESCWHSNPRCRPTFTELLDKLKNMQRQREFPIELPF
ncbi:hypothetical protein MKX03_014329 [Papaver bracteatum]|nr:hypothetical protein MKX03_014329 [Papaver bracteatum]